MKIYPGRHEMVSDVIKPGSFGAEIGVHRGEFARHLLSLPAARIYLVDAWQAYSGYASERHFNQGDHNGHLERVRSRFAGQIESGQARIVRGFSAAIAQAGELPPLDWVFIDANHTYESTLIDLVAWSLRLNPGGVIMGHDYIERPHENFGVIRAVQEFCERFEWEIVALTSEEITSYLITKCEKPGEKR